MISIEGILNVQPLASVISTEYVPTPRLEISSVVSPLDQANV